MNYSDFEKQSNWFKDVSSVIDLIHRSNDLKHFLDVLITGISLEKEHLKELMQNSFYDKESISLKVDFLNSMENKLIQVRNLMVLI